MPIRIVKKGAENNRKRDPYLDRRSGDDRRQVYSLAYFNNGGIERRNDTERRKNEERRKDCFRTTTWSSVCPDR